MLTSDFDRISAEVQRRLNWSARHVQALTDSVHAWEAASHPALAGVLSPDCRSAELHIEGLAPTPVEEWGFLFGDAIHNLRSLLNNLLHSIAVAGALPREDIKRLQFPVVETQADWTKANGGSRHQVRGLPSSVIASIESLQPYNRGSSDSVAHILWLLNDLSNADKHRVATLPAQTATSLDLTVTAELFDPDQDPVDGEVIFVNEPTVLARVNFGQPVRTVRFDAKVALTAFVFDSRGRQFEVGPLLENLLREVVGVANTILMDWKDAAETPEPDALPE